MKRFPVISSSIRSIGYDEKSHTMQIEFINRDVYEYYDVPKTEYDSFISSESIGTFFMNHIRAQYRYTEV